MALMFELPFNYKKSPEQAKRYNFREIIIFILKSIIVFHWYLIKMKLNAFIHREFG